MTLGKAELKIFLGAMSTAVQGKIRRLAKKRKTTPEAVVEEAIKLFEDVAEGDGSQFADHPIVKAYLKFRGGKAARTLGAKGVKKRAIDGGNSLWTQKDGETEADLQKRISDRVDKMNKARAAKRKTAKS